MRKKCKECIFPFIVKKILNTEMMKFQDPGFFKKKINSATCIIPPRLYCFSSRLQGRGCHGWELKNLLGIYGTDKAWIIL